MATALYAEDPATRLAAALRTDGRQRRRVLRYAGETWPADSPGSVNAWLLMLTTKAPTWRDPFVDWLDHPPTLGDPHEGFFYPDPLGFWAEVRHWASALVGLQPVESVTLTTLLHGKELDWAIGVMRPRVILFLDEPAWHQADIDVARQVHHIPDPYRPGQVYEGWWGQTDDGTVVGKSPQHPAAHKLYKRSDMDRFLTACHTEAPTP